MSEQEIILDNESFEQDLQSGLSDLTEDSTEQRRRKKGGKRRRRAPIRNSSRKRSKALAAAKRRVKKAQTNLRKVRRRVR